MDLQELLKLIDTGRDVRRENVEQIRKYMGQESLKEVVQIILKNKLPRKTYKDVAKSLVIVGLATGHLGLFEAEMYAEAIRDSWVRWNILELGL